MSTAQSQWDMGDSEFTIAGKALVLLKAATVDNVHPTAVYAAETLGSTLTVSPELIAKAVDALNGRENFQMQNLKLQFELSERGIASQIKQSTPAVRTFLLIAILTAYLESHQIGEMLYTHA